MASQHEQIVRPNEVPEGTTHFQDVPEPGVRQFWKRIFTHYNSVNEERLQPMYRYEWFDAHIKRWISDSPQRFPLQPIKVGEDRQDVTESMEPKSRLRP